MSDELISVVVTVHNTKMYLPQCVRSILDQTYKNLEVILVDDGSTDGCAELCDRYGKEDSRVRVIHQGALGAAAARAAGMRAVKGDFTHFVDDDDWMDLNMEEEMLKAQRKSNADIVICGHYVERGGRSRKGGSGYFTQEGVYDRKRLEREIFPRMMSVNGTRERGIHPNLWMKLFRTETCRDAILRVDPRILKANDVAACYEALFAANKIVILPERYYHYRLGRPKSITTSYVEKYYESMLALLEHLASSPMAQRPEIAKQIPRIVRSCLSYGMQGGCGKGGAESHVRTKLMTRLTQLEQSGARRTIPRPARTPEAVSPPGNSNESARIAQRAPRTPITTRPRIILTRKQPTS
ncbi:MAG: glycosyltransferase [Oscillospiraceae bacterium]|jgi:glycosyltransferase involved in cell wall biosynthesis|nr:glycosyltransferase [Oscillospiraceae bacterium]